MTKRRSKSDGLLAGGLFDLGALCELAALEIDEDSTCAEYPMWVHAAGRRVTRALFSQAIEARRRGCSRAYALGFAFGMMDVGSRKLGEDMAKLPTTMPILSTEEADEAANALVHLLYGDEKATLPGDSLVSVEVRTELRQKESTLTSKEMEEFHRGGLAAARMIRGKNKANDATDIYLFMVMCWRLVEQLKSVEQLHEVLTTMFGRNRIGADVGRTRQICQRVKKRFRKPGRPRKQRQVRG